MKHVKALLKTVLAFCMIIMTIPVSAEVNNPATDWLSEAVYGVDGPAPAVARENLDIYHWEEQYNAFDVKQAVQVAAETGAGYMMVNVVTGWGYLMSPNPVYDQITGREAGERTAKRDLIEEYYQELNKRGMKLMLYFNIDGPHKDPDDYAAMGGTWCSNPTFDERWGSVAKYWSEKYGEKIAGWWVDGAFLDTGYGEQAVLQHWMDMLKAGNPNSVVAFNPGVRPETDWSPAYGVGDFLGGENYGIDLTASGKWMKESQLRRYYPSGRWFEGQQWHRYLPLSEYCTEGSAYSVKDLVEYMLEVKKQGGVVTFGLSSTGGGKVDPLQQEMLSAVKKYVKDGEAFPESSFDGSVLIEAGNCTTMSNVGFLQPSLSLSPILCTSGEKGKAIRYNIPPQDALFRLIPESYPAGNDLKMWSTYENVTIKSGVNCLVMSVKELSPGTSHPYGFSHKVQLKTGGPDGEVLCSIDGIEAVEWFVFGNNKRTTILNNTSKVQPGYVMKTFDVSISPGVHELSLVNILKENKERVRSAYEQIDFLDMSSVESGIMSPVEDSEGNLRMLGNMDGGDMIAFRNLDFGQGAKSIKIRLANEEPYAGQKVAIYDGHPDKGGSLITRITVPDTGSFTTYDVYEQRIYSTLRGMHDLYFLCEGKNFGIGNFDWFKFEPGVTYEELTYYTMSGNQKNPITALQHGRIYASMKVNKEWYLSVKSMIVVGVYEKATDKLLSVSVGNLSSSLTSAQLTTYVDIPEDIPLNTVELRAMVWEDFDSMNPIFPISSLN